MPFGKVLIPTIMCLTICYRVAAKEDSVGLSSMPYVPVEADTRHVSLRRSATIKVEAEC